MTTESLLLGYEDRTPPDFRLPPPPRPKRTAEEFKSGKGIWILRGVCLITLSFWPMVTFWYLLWELFVWWNNNKKATNYQQALERHVEEEKRLAAERKRAPRWYPLHNHGAPQTIDVIGTTADNWFGLLSNLVGPGARRAVVLNVSISSGVVDVYFQHLSARQLVESFDPIAESQSPELVVTSLFHDRNRDVNYYDHARAVIDTVLKETLGGHWTLPRVAGALAAFTGLSNRETPYATVLSEQEWMSASRLHAAGSFADGDIDEARRMYHRVHRLLAGYAVEPTQARPPVPWSGPHRVLNIECRDPDLYAEDTLAVANMLCASCLYSSAPGTHELVRDLVVIVGADELPHETLTSLTKRVHRRGAVAVRVFERIDDEVAKSFGHGVTSATLAFHVGPGDQAKRLADHLGKQIFFVEKSRASSQNHSVTETIGESWSTTVTRGRQSSSGTGPGGMTSSRGSNAGTSQTKGGSWSRGETFGTGRTVTEERVEEYRIRPEDLQSLRPNEFIYVPPPDSGGEIVRGRAETPNDPALISPVPVRDPRSWWSEKQSVGHPWLFT